MAGEQGADIAAPSFCLGCFPTSGGLLVFEAILSLSACHPERRYGLDAAAYENPEQADNSRAEAGGKRGPRCWRGSWQVNLGGSGESDLICFTASAQGSVSPI